MDQAWANFIFIDEKQNNYIYFKEMYLVFVLKMIHLRFYFAYLGIKNEKKK